MGYTKKNNNNFLEKRFVKKNIIGNLESFFRCKTSN